MLRHRRLRDAGAVGQRTDALFAVQAELLEQAAPRGVAKRSEKSVRRRLSRSA
jgi:hypothetical protein